MALLENEVELVTKLCNCLQVDAARKTPKVPLTVLELGCGMGKLALHLHEVLPDLALVGIDPERSKVAKAQQHSPAISFLVQSAERLAFKPQVFDAVVSLKALHEFPRPGEALQEAYPALRVEGRIYLIDWIGGIPETSGHRHSPNYFTPEQLTQALAAVGFTGITITCTREAGLMLAEAVKPRLSRGYGTGAAVGGSHSSIQGAPAV
jgi:ubiquinone/menaquinone biosynthesis C-methylase UbiE